MPVVSVIIPVYNGEKTIQETIEAVLNQTLSDFELLIINDGSQDATVEIVERFQDTRLKIFSYPNAGLAASRNRGIALAVSNYIAFLDADDLWTPDKLEAQFKALQANPHAAVAYSWTDCIDESGQFSRQGSHITVSGNVYANLLLVNFLENGSNPLIRREVLTEVGGFDESLTAAEDWDMYLRLAAMYHFLAVPSPQILYRVSIKSMSSNLTKQETETLKVLEQAYTQASKSLQHLKRHSLANFYTYLTFKCLEGIPERGKSLAAIRFLLHIVKNDLSILHNRIIWMVLLRIVIVIFIPTHLALALLAKKKHLFNPETLFTYNKVNPSDLKISHKSS